MSTKATTGELGGLHALIARTLSNEIEKAKDLEDGVPPQLLAQAIKFLKDNNITASDADDPEMQKLRKVYEGNVIGFPFDPAAAQAGR